MQTHTQKDEINFHRALNTIRKIKHITLKDLAEGLCSESEMQRIVKGERLPEKLMRDRFMARMGICGEFYEDYLQPDEYKCWELRQNILKSIEKKNFKTLEQYLKQYERLEIIGKMDLQFIGTMWIWFYKNTSQFIELEHVIEKNVHLTMPKIAESFPQKLLLSSQEINLLTEYVAVRTYHGCIEEEVNWRLEQYKCLLCYIEQSYMNKIEKAKIYPKTVYYICQFVLKKGKILEQQYAFKICNQAIQLLRDTEKLYYFVELLEQKIQLIRIIQKELGEKGKVRFIARFQAILKETIEWRELFLKLYKENEISPYMQHDCHIYWEQNSYAIGDIIKIRRKMFGIKREQLCEGICSERTLMRMELKQVKSQMPIVRPIFERLGLCAEYMRARVITSDIEMIQLAENLSGYINNYEMEKWEEGLNILEKKLCMKIACNKQQIIRQRSLLELEKCQISTREFIEKTIEALECTIPLESVLKNKEIYLTNEEILCIFNIGMRETSVQNQYLFVLENICNKYIQEDKIVENISIFELLMTEIASYLGNRQKYNQSDKMALQVLQRSLYCRRMNLIVNNLYNQVWNYRKRVEENLFVPHNYNEIVELKRCILLTEICQAKNKKIFLEKELENLKDN